MDGWDWAWVDGRTDLVVALGGAALVALADGAEHGLPGRVPAQPLLELLLPHVLKHALVLPCRVCGVWVWSVGMGRVWMWSGAGRPEAGRQPLSTHHPVGAARERRLLVLLVHARPHPRPLLLVAAVVGRRRSCRRRRGRAGHHGLAWGRKEGPLLIQKKTQKAAARCQLLLHLRLIEGAGRQAAGLASVG